MTLAEAETRVILDTLERNGWRRTNTARELGIDPSTLWRKLKHLRISEPPKNNVD